MAIAFVPEAWREYYDGPPPFVGPTPQATVAWFNMNGALQAGFMNCHARIQRRRGAIVDARNAIVAADAKINGILAAVPRHWDEYTRAAQARAGYSEALAARLHDLVNAFLDFRNFPAAIGRAWDVVIQARITAEENAATAQRGVENPLLQNDYNLWMRRARTPPVPADAAGRRKIPLNHLPDFARRYHFQRVNPPGPFTGPPLTVHHPIWRGGWMIGRGGMSNTGLWVRLSPTRTVQDRVFVKQCNLASQWTGLNYWSGNVRDPAARTPMEVACQQAMCEIPSRSTRGRMAPGMRHWEVDRVAKEAIMYMEYCGLGTLSDLIAQYNENDENLPEAFLWYCFLTLAEICLALETGHQAVPPAAAPPGAAPMPPVAFWKQIIHRDIKPSNIFLDRKSPNWFKNYPTPKLGDYGLAIRTTPADPLNPSGFNNGAGTDGFRAPETRLYVDVANRLQPVAPFPILSPANIWSIGQVMYCLISHDANPPQMDYMGDGTDVNTTPDVATNNPSGFSAQLVNLVQSCLRFDPAQRPTPTALVAHIDAAIDTGGVPGRGAAFGMQRPMQMSTLADRREQALSNPRDRYAVRMAENALPPVM